MVIADLTGAAETVQLVRDAGGGTATAFLCDVSDPDSVAALAASTAELGGIDILVNNAGIYPMGALDTITFAEWRRVLSINLDSVFLLSQAYLP